MLRRMLVGWVVWMVCCPAGAQDVAPVWTIEMPRIASLVWNDDRLAVYSWAEKIVVVDLATGATVWTVAHPSKPDDIGACKAFVAVRYGEQVRTYDTKSGKPGLDIGQIMTMAVLGGNMFCRSEQKMLQYLPPSPASAVIKLNPPFRLPFDAKLKAILMGDRVVWPQQSGILGCYDFASCQLAWRSSWGCYTYVARQAGGSATDAPRPMVKHVVWDEHLGYFPFGDRLTLHMSHMMVHGSKDSKEVRAEYLWTFDVRKGGEGVKTSVQPTATDKPGATKVYWGWATPKPWLIARHEHIEGVGQYRFDVYPAGGSIDLRTRYVPFENVVAGAKGQIVAWTEPAKPTEPRTFEVLTATPAAKTLWMGNGTALPRIDDKEPYIAIEHVASTDRTMVYLHDPATGKELATTELGPQRWMPIPIEGHLLFGDRAGKILRLDRDTLAVTHRAAVNAIVDGAMLLGPNDVLVRTLNKVTRLSFAPAAVPVAEPPAK